MSMRRIFNDWRLFWPLQALLSGLTALTGTFLPLMLPTLALPLKILFLWLGACAAGAWSSFRLTRIGLSCYAAWLAPPIFHTAAPWLAIGYPPSVGSALLCAFVSMAAAACADALARLNK